jgi:hypothetical protein
VLFIRVRWDTVSRFQRDFRGDLPSMKLWEGKDGEANYALRLRSDSTRTTRLELAEKSGRSLAAGSFICDRPRQCPLDSFADMGYSIFMSSVYD